MLVAFHMREALFEGRAYFERDIHLQWFGQMKTLVLAIQSGWWPLWDPYVAFGQPLLANANNQLFYPPTWLNLMLSPAAYYTLYLLTHLMFAGFGVWRLSRHWGVSTPGAFVAAALWISAGPLLSLGNVWNHLAGAALAPWLVLVADRAICSSGPRSLLVLGAALALPLLAGSPDTLVLLAPLLLGLAVVGSGPDRSGAARSRAWRLLLGAAAGACLGAAQLLPSLDLVAQSSRSNLPAGERAFWSVHPVVALQTLIPLRWDDLPLNPDAWALYFDSREPYLYSLYVGLPALALAGLGATRAGHRHRRLLVAIIAVSLLVAFGRHTPIYAGLVELLPPLRLIRFPAKAMLLVSLAIALLAGSGFDVWCRRCGTRRGFGGGGAPFATEPPWDRRRAPPGDRTRRAVSGPLLGRTAAAMGVLSLALLAAAAAGGQASGALVRTAVLAFAVGLLALLAQRRPAWALTTAAVAAAAGVVDLSVFHHDLNPTAPVGFYRVSPGFLRDFDRNAGGRLLVFDYEAAPGLAKAFLGRERPYGVRVRAGEGGSRDEWRGAMGRRLYPVAPVTGGFQVLGSFGRDLLRIWPDPVVRLNRFAARTLGTATGSRLMVLGGVTRLVTLHDVTLAGAPPAARFPGPFGEDVRSYEVPGAIGRCVVVDGVKAADLPEDLTAPDFDPSRSVLLAQRPARSPSPSFEGSCRIERTTTDRVVVEVSATASAFVVLADAWSPGWSADIDDRPAEVLRANVAFRAVEVPAGHHRVHFLYRPRAVTIGLAVSLLSFVVAGVVCRREALARPRICSPALPEEEKREHSAHI